MKRTYLGAPIVLLIFIAAASLLVSDSVLAFTPNTGNVPSRKNIVGTNKRYDYPSTTTTTSTPGGFKSARTSPLFISSAIGNRIEERKQQEIKTTQLNRFAMKTFANIQLWLIMHPNKLTKFLASVCYFVDLGMFAIDGPKKFLIKRQELLGKNFAALGRIHVSEYSQAVEILASPQKRGTYLGPINLNGSKCPAKFLLFLDDKEAGGSDLHSKLHLGFWETVASSAINRINDDSTGVFKRYIEEGKKNVEHAENPVEKDVEVFKMTIRYVFHAVYGTALPSEDYVTMVYDRYQNRKTSPINMLSRFFLAGTANPVATIIAPFQFGYKHSTKKLIEFVMESSLIETYVPKDEYGNVPKEEWADLVLAVTGIAGVLGTSLLNCNILEHAVMPDINTKDKDEVTNAVLESCRIEPPVNIVNTITPKEKVLVVNNKKVTIPANSIVASSIGAASFDADEFPDPLTFDPKRKNLVDSILNFNHHGWDPETLGTRVCPGRTIAMKMASDWLIALNE